MEPPTELILIGYWDGPSMGPGWPEGLAHYVTDHDVRLPERFVQHVLTMVDAIETADRDENWWRQVAPGATTTPVGSEDVDAAGALP